MAKKNLEKFQPLSCFSRLRVYIFHGKKKKKKITLIAYLFSSYKVILDFVCITESTSTINPKNYTGFNKAVANYGSIVNCQDSLHFSIKPPLYVEIIKHHQTKTVELLSKKKKKKSGANKPL